MSDKKDKDAQLIAIETLTGDIRDILLPHVRSMEDPWSKLSERAQQDKIEAIDRCARTLVARAVKIVATEGFDRIEVRTGKFTNNKGEIKLEVTASSSVDNARMIIENGSSAILVFADPSDFHGERAAVRPDPDEPGLPLEAADDGDDGGDDSLFDVDPDEPEDNPDTDFPDIPADLDRRQSSHGH